MISALYFQYIPTIYLITTRYPQHVLKFCPVVVPKHGGAKSRSRPCSPQAWCPVSSSSSSSAEAKSAISDLFASSESGGCGGFQLVMGESMEV